MKPIRAIRSTTSIGAVLMCVSFGLLAQAVDRKTPGNGFPDDTAMEKALRDTRMPSDAELGLQASPRPPQFKLGTPVPGVDLGALVEKYGSKLGTPKPQATERQLLVFVSLGMPSATLKKLATDAARCGAHLVLRGLKDNSFRATALALKALTTDVNVGWSIDPPAFKRYAVIDAPTIVMTLPNVGTDEPPSSCSNTCANATEIMRVRGDVSISYALKQIKNRSPRFRADADAYLRRLGG